MTISVEELASLLKKGKSSGVHIDPIFDNKQINCWTADQYDTNNMYNLGAWFISFKDGRVSLSIWYDKKTMPGWSGGHSFYSMIHARAVRSTYK